MRNNYRVIRSRYVDGKLVQKILSKDSQQLQIPVLDIQSLSVLGLLSSVSYQSIVIFAYITPGHFEIRFVNAFVKNR